MVLHGYCALHVLISDFFPPFYVPVTSFDFMSSERCQFNYWSVFHQILFPVELLTFLSADFHMHTCILISLYIYTIYPLYICILFYFCSARHGTWSLTRQGSPLALFHAGSSLYFGSNPVKWSVCLHQQAPQ